MLSERGPSVEAGSEQGVTMLLAPGVPLRRHNRPEGLHSRHRSRDGRAHAPQAAGKSDAEPLDSGGRPVGLATERAYLHRARCAVARLRLGVAEVIHRIVLSTLGRHIDARASCR